MTLSRAVGTRVAGTRRVGKDQAKVLMAYLDVISITANQKAIRYTLFTGRADLNRIYSKGSKEGSFCEVDAKRCKHGFYDLRKYSTYEPGLPR